MLEQGICTPFGVGHGTHMTPAGFALLVAMVYRWGKRTADHWTSCQQEVAQLLVAALSCAYQKHSVCEAIDNMHTVIVIARDSRISWTCSVPHTLLGLTGNGKLHSPQLNTGQ
jgi:hypothetical protein